LIGGDVRGTALFPDDLTDQIKGGFEDWWETKAFAAFTFQGGGIDFKTSKGDYSSLRLEDGGIRALEAETLWYPREDALHYEGVEGSNSLLLALSGGGGDALLRDPVASRVRFRISSWTEASSSRVRSRPMGRRMGEAARSSSPRKGAGLSDY